MRRCVFALLLIACDSTDLPSQPAAAQPDLAQAASLPDLAQPAPSQPDLATAPHPSNGFQCGTMSCGGGTVCCVTGTTPACVATCPSGSFVAECNGPENCGGFPCCVTVSAGYKVHDVSCTTQATDCPPNIDTNSGSGQERACHHDADCTSGAPGTNLPDCCTNTSTGQHVCFNKLAVALVMGFTCP